jgi:hypothetical protein
LGHPSTYRVGVGREEFSRTDAVAIAAEAKRPDWRPAHVIEEGVPNFQDRPGGQGTKN